ncbi:hypothetical protein ACP70R_007434 [Stipagrostis hirtigluma subsp. patula]
MAGKDVEEAALGTVYMTGVEKKADPTTEETEAVATAETAADGNGDANPTTEGTADDAAAGASNDGDEDGEATEEEWVELPDDYLVWILSQRPECRSFRSLEDGDIPETSSVIPQEAVDRQRELIRKMSASLQASDEFFAEFQEWFRDTLKRNGRVMVPANFFDPAPEIQQQIDEIWADEMKKLGIDVNALFPGIMDGTEAAGLPSNS